MRPQHCHTHAGAVDLNVAAWPGEQPLLLLHGLAMRWQSLAPLASALGPDWRIVAPDLPGHGGSDRTPGRYDVTAFADHVAGVLDADLAPSVVVGHSLGGWVALRIAATHPDRVAAVVVIDSALFPGELPRSLLATHMAPLGLARRSLTRALATVDPDVIESMRDGRMTAGYDPAELLPAIECPVLLLQGDARHGAHLTDADARRALALLRRGHVVRIGGTGHNMPLVAPGPTAAAVRSFLTPMALAA